MFLVHLVNCVTPISHPFPIIFHQMYHSNLLIHNNFFINFSGVYGMQRAVVLSFPGLQHTKYHLELAVNPISLSSNVSLRHFPFNKNIIFIRISINPPDRIKTVEIFTINPKGPKLYACGSACEHVVEVR